MKKFDLTKKERKSDALDDSAVFGGGFSAEPSFSLPGESLAPGFDKSKKANQPSLGLKNFKNASKKGQVSETPIGSPRAMQMAAKLAALQAILERKKADKERDEAEARGEVWVNPNAAVEATEEEGTGQDEDGTEEPPDSPTKDELMRVGELLSALDSYKEGEELEPTDLAIFIFEADPYYDDGYDAPFNQGNWDDAALPEGFPEMCSPQSPEGALLGSSPTTTDRGRA